MNVLRMECKHVFQRQDSRCLVCDCGFRFPRVYGRGTCIIETNIGESSIETVEK